MSRASTSTALHADFTGGETRRIGEGKDMAPWEFARGEAHPLGEPMFIHATPG